MDAYIDIVSAEIRSLQLPESEDSDDKNNKKVNRPLPIAVAIMCAIASCTLASCWIAVTADVNKMLTVICYHSLFLFSITPTIKVICLFLCNVILCLYQNMSIIVRCTVLIQCCLCS